MIVNLKSDGWEIIYHRAHALLAAQIAGYWNFQQDSHTHYAYETIAAISQHDDLEREWQEDQITEAGAPLDFTLEKTIEIEQMRCQVEEALYRSRWVAMLTSMHLHFLNTPRRQDSKELDRFLKEQEGEQTRWRRELDVSQEDADAAYRFMRWCDRLSLILCQQQIPDAGRKLEINIGPNGDMYEIYRSEEMGLTITPWPFRAQRVELRVEASHLEQLKFDSNEQLRSALKQAPRYYRTWQLQRLA